MEKVTREFEVYRFEELDDKAKERALQWFSEDSDLFQWRSETFIDMMKSEAPKYFLIDKVYWSGFCNQGDGASWAGYVDLKEYAKAMNDPDLLAAIEIGAIEDKPVVHKSTHRYQHELTMTFEIDQWDYLDEEQAEALGKTDKDIQDMIKKAEEDLLEEARDYAREIYRTLEKDYEYTYSEESLKDMAEANEWTFNKDGSFFRF